MRSYEILVDTCENGFTSTVTTTENGVSSEPRLAIHATGYALGQYVDNLVGRPPGVPPILTVIHGGKSEPGDAPPTYAA